ncbi:SMC-Scp complex subunit ScpB [bacterium]|nr:SMC-Scp complex subunit ScpB [bacterium]
MEQKEIKAIIECLLFVGDKPMSLGVMQGLLEDVDRRTVLACLDELKAEYDMQGRAFHLVEIAEGYQLATRVQYAPWIRKMFKTRTSNKLSRAALETLAIIAYRQPITKAEIEDIRGVSADGVVNALLDRKFIRIVGRKEVIGRPILYGTTKEFLHYFGLKDLTDMPMLKDLQDILESDDAGQAWEMNQQGELIAKVKVGEEGEADEEQTMAAESEQQPEVSQSDVGASAEENEIVADDSGNGKPDIELDPSKENDEADEDETDEDEADEDETDEDETDEDETDEDEADEDDNVNLSELEEEPHPEDGNGHNDDHAHAEEIVTAEIQAGELEQEKKTSGQQSEMEKDDPAGE